MGAVMQIPFEEMALHAEEVGKILGYQARTVIEVLAVREGFPERLSIRPASWRAGDILAWRDANRVGRQARSRRRGNTAKGS